MYLILTYLYTERTPCAMHSLYRQTSIHLASEMIGGDDVPIGRREKKKKFVGVETAPKSASLSSLDEEIQRLARELDECSSQTEDDEVDGEGEEEEVESTMETQKNVLILSSLSNESDRIRPLHSNALPSNTCKTKPRGSATTKVEQHRESMQW